MKCKCCGECEGPVGIGGGGQWPGGTSGGKGMSAVGGRGKKKAAGAPAPPQSAEEVMPNLTNVATSLLRLPE